MKKELALYKQNWWMYLVSGIVTLLFGFLAVVNPAQTLLSISVFFGLYLLIRGLTEVVLSLSGSRTKELWFVSLAFGAIEAGIGVYLLQRPLLSIKTFIAFVAIALAIRATIYTVEAFDSNYNSAFRAWHGIAAAISLIASVYIWRYPIQGSLAFVWVLGVYALLTGPLVIAFALAAKNGFKD